MKKYTIEVSKTYTETIEVEANSIDEAKELAYDLFDIEEAWQSDDRVEYIREEGVTSWLDIPLPLGNIVEGETP
jgi:hypothetical protein